MLLDLLSPRKQNLSTGRCTTPTQTSIQMHSVQPMDGCRPSKSVTALTLVALLLVSKSKTLIRRAGQHKSKITFFNEKQLFGTADHIKYFQNIPLLNWYGRTLFCAVTFLLI